MLQTLLKSRKTQTWTALDLLAMEEVEVRKLDSRPTRVYTLRRITVTYLDHLLRVPLFRSVPLCPCAHHVLKTLLSIPALSASSLCFPFSVTELLEHERSQISKL